ncbi:uncharacterized protein F5147DRAFT_807643 [Suillus discolor]|uniref:Uncharacterized protein n=1 Tax=Suillus discolor TaxID=1912936 RepID=A0A9P7JS70_9AGAM|nr:uncharacterized protein F5147DRAFT_807643 [Suillus discolor]KAG2104311.1 hypothetical protein F5147DRAFT_807643 [Suillus discolor]
MSLLRRLPSSSTVVNVGPPYCTHPSPVAKFIEFSFNKTIIDDEYHTHNRTCTFSKSTKFNDLPDDIKRTLKLSRLTSHSSHIQGCIQISNELKQRKMGEEAIKGQELIRELHKELLGVSSVIQSDSLLRQGPESEELNKQFKTRLSQQHHRGL